MRVDLITGFLGAGKTTFLKKYVTYLKARGEHFRIIENEFCAWGVDTHLLHDVHDDIQDLSGYCMCCTGKDKFIAMLMQAAEAGYNRVLVEPSGIYDVDEFFQVMALPSITANSHIGSVITIVDPGLAVDSPQPNEVNDYLMLTQLLAAGCILVSKTGLYPPQTCSRALSLVGEQLAPYLLEDHEPMIICRDWSSFTDEDFAAMDASGFRQVAHDRKLLSHATLYSTCMTAARCADENDLRERIARLFSEKTAGDILRVKGFVKDSAGDWFSVNCTPKITQIRRAQIRRGLCIVIGQDVQERLVRDILD